MADLKFHCPECQQKVAVDESAAGMAIECPRCRSGLVIPATQEAAVKVTVRRKLATMAMASGAYEELERKLRYLLWLN